MIDVQAVAPRPLTLPELRALSGELADQECAAIALTCGLDIELVTGWYNSAPAGDVLKLVKKMWAASGIGDVARKSD